MKRPGITTSNPIDGWRNTGPSLELRSELLRTLLALWTSKRDGDKLPGRGDFSAEELMSFGGRVALVDVELDPPRYRFRLIGSHITDTLGRDSTGRYLDEVYERSYYAQLAESYRRIIETRMPERAYGSMAHSDKPYVFVEAIDLPLAEDGETIDMMLKGTEFFSS